MGNPLSLRGRRKPPPLPGHRGVEGGGLGRSNKIRIPWQPSPAQPAEGLACSCSAPTTSETSQTGSRAAPCFPACPTDRRVGGPTLSVTYHITRRAAGFPFLFPQNPPAAKTHPPQPQALCCLLLRLFQLTFPTHYLPHNLHRTSNSFVRLAGGGCRFVPREKVLLPDKPSERDVHKVLLIVRQLRRV
jgi:hypothetical protein